LAFGEPRFPKTHPFTIEGIDEEFHTYDGKVEIVVPVVSGIREEGTAQIEVKVSYQACTDAMCYIPRTETLALELSTAPNVAKLVD
jgi:thiol:disulfide interchange protein